MTAKSSVSMILTALLLLASSVPALADAPGGILETPQTAQARPRPTASQIQAFLPARGAFTFPAPYHTRGVRLTNAGDCGGSDCVFSVGYAYWRNINNHVNSDTLYAFIGLKGGRGPTLYSYHKVTEETRNLGPLFDPGTGYASLSGEGMYFSGTRPHALYLHDGPRMLRYDVITRQFETVFDVRAQFGAEKTIWQMQSSDDDRVHSATLRGGGYEFLGCLVYHEDAGRFQYFPARGAFDECHVDKSGRWLMSLESITGYGNDMRIFDLTTGAERLVSDPDGAVGHPDMGYGYVVGADNMSNLSNAQKVWDFSSSALSGALVHWTASWDAAAPNHTSHTNARPGVPVGDQFACGSGATTSGAAWGNEIICFRLDGSMNVVIAAPVMTDMNAASGGDAYDKQPKGNLDITGEYFIWTTNTGGNRVDAFLVKLPSQLLFGGASQPPPTPVPPPGPLPTPGPLAVTDVQATPSATGAAIDWATNVASDSMVEYGATPDYGSVTELDANLLLSHAAVLSGLAPGTLYHYRVRSQDTLGNLVVSPDFTFVTLAEGSAPPPSGGGGPQPLPWGNGGCMPAAVLGLFALAAWWRRRRT